MALDDRMVRSEAPETFGVAEAKRRFSELVDRVQSGERFVVARRGKPAVALVPAKEAVETDDPKPLGLLAFAGALAEWDDIDDFVKEIYASRQRAKDRPSPFD